MIQPTIKTSNDIRNLRQRLNMSQKVFCETYGLNLRSYQAWETKKPPRQIALLLLTLIDKDPTWVAKTLTEIVQERGFANFGEMNAKRLQKQGDLPARVTCDRLGFITL